ncbi:MAG: oligosaccharide flippase family protein [Bacteroidetes bacterium]|nr:oligosaccharide flippase family protein [Bacteroidota bacterium]
MQRKFLTNLSLLLFLNLLVKPFWIFGIDRTVQNLVGSGEYGWYSSLMNFTFLFNILLDFGITNFNNKNIAQNNHLLNKHFSGIVIFKFILAIIYIIVTMAVGFIWGYDSRQMFFLLVLGFNQILISLILYLRSNISGLLHFKTDSLVSVLDRLLMILICSLLLWGGFTNHAFRIEWFVYAQTAAYIITAMVAMLIVMKKAAFKRLQWNPAFFILIIKQSYPFAVLVLLMTFYNRIDSVMLERMLPGEKGDVQAGVYASAYRLLDAINMIAYLFSVILLPMFARLIKDRKPVESLVKLAFTLIFTLAITASVALCIYNHEFMDFLYTKHINDSAAVFRFLILGFIPISTTYIFGTLLTANGNLKWLNIIAFSGMILNISLNYFLIPVMMAVGSAYASLITQFFTAILQIVMVQRLFKFKVNHTYLISLLLFSIGTIVLSILAKYTGIEWKAGFIASCTGSLLIAVLLRLINFKSIRILLRSNERIE